MNAINVSELELKGLDFPSIDATKQEINEIRETLIKKNIPMLGSPKLSVTDKIVLRSLTRSLALTPAAIHKVNREYNMPKSFISWIFSTSVKLIKRFYKIFMTKEKLIKDILKDADRHYQELRNDLTEMSEKEFNGTKSPDFIFLLPDIFVWLCRLMADKRIDKRYKARIAFCIVYIISPIDLIPEGLMAYHPISLADDLFITLLTLDELLNSNKLNFTIARESWPGRKDVLDDVKSIFNDLKTWLGDELAEKIMRFYKRKFA